MKGTIIFRGPPHFRSFEIAHRIEGAQHWFEVSYGSSFNELYYDFTPSEFFASADRQELEKQLVRAGAANLLPAIKSILQGSAQVTSAQLQALLAEGARAQQGIQPDGPASGGSAG